MSRGEITEVDGRIIRTGKPPVAIVSDVLKEPTALTWSPVQAPTRLTFLGTSFPAVRVALEGVFGKFPIRLSRSEIRVLEGMVAASGEGAEPYHQLMVALSKFGELELRLE